MAPQVSLVTEESAGGNFPVSSEEKPCEGVAADQNDDNFNIVFNQKIKMQMQKCTQ